MTRQQGLLFTAGFRALLGAHGRSTMETANVAEAARTDFQDEQGRHSPEVHPDILRMRTLPVFAPYGAVPFHGLFEASGVTRRRLQSFSVAA